MFGRSRQWLPSSASAFEVAGLGLVVVVAPIVFDPAGNAGVLAVKVLAVGAGLAVLGARVVWDRALAVPWGWVAAAAGAALLVMGAATLASAAVERSFLGAPQRLSGLLMWLSATVAFVVGFSLRRARAEPLEGVVVRVGVAGVLAVGALAVLEAAGGGWDTGAAEFEGRLRSTLGNPSVLAAFVLLVGPLCVAAAVSGGRWWWPGMAGCGLGCVMLVGSQSRGAIAAFAVAAVVFAVVRVSRPTRWWVLGAAGVLVAATAVFGRWGELGFGLRGRVAIWEVALETIADRPLLGVGPEMFVVEYSERVGAGTVREFGRVGAVDRAHSGLLDFAVSFGVVAGAAYLAVLAAVGVVAVKAMASQRVVQAGLGAGLVAYMAQQLVFFPHPATEVVFWLFAGVLVGAAGVESRPVRSWLVAAAAACVVLGLIANSWSAVRNELDFERARSAETYAEAFGHLSEAADRRAFDDEPYILMGALLQGTDDLGLIAAGEARIVGGESQNPGSELVSLALAEVRLQGFRVSGDPRWARRALIGLDGLVGAQPANGAAYLKRGAAWFYLGDLASAEADWRQAAWLLPGDEAPADNLRQLGEQRDAARSRPVGDLTTERHKNLW